MKQTVIPQLRIRDAARSLPFYLQGLGFQIDWEHRFDAGLPLFAQISREGQTLFLTEHSGEGEVGAVVYLMVPDVDACAAAFRAAGLTDFEGPQDTPWGTREMRLRDPDGNHLRWATHSDEG